MRRIVLLLIVLVGCAAPAPATHPVGAVNPSSLRLEAGDELGLRLAESARRDGYAGARAQSDP